MKRWIFLLKYITYILTNKSEVFTITCSVIDTLTQDCIFGFNLIKQNKTLRNIMFHTLLHDEDLEDIQKIIHTFHKQKKSLDNKQLHFARANRMHQ